MELKDVPITQLDLLGLTGTTTDLRKKEIDTERSVLVLQVALQLSNLLAQHLWGVTDTTDDAETTGIGDRSSQLGAGSHVHASQQNWVVDLQEISDGSANNLCAT